jgi:dTDP-4-dehydrorhamnose 3,5-epimerase-like enzyme
MSHLKNTKNTLLVKDEEGKVRQTTYDLPEDKHTYGKKIIDDP